MLPSLPEMKPSEKRKARHCQSQPEEAHARDCSKSIISQAPLLPVSFLALPTMIGRASLNKMMEPATGNNLFTQGNASQRHTRRQNTNVY